MGRILKILGGVLGVVVVGLAGVVVYALNVDLNNWKPEIQDAVREQTGRLLVINGPIEFELGSDTYLKATEITLSNASWGSRRQMVEVGTVEVGLKLFSLLGNSPDITLVNVDTVRAIIETDANGLSNTDFSAGAAGAGASEPAQDTSSAGGSGSGDLILPILRDVRIADVEVVMKDGVAGTEQAFVLTELTLGSESQTSPLMLNLDAAYDGLDLIMQGQMGSLVSMTDAGTATPIDIIGNLAGIDLAVNGQIQDLAGQKGIDITVSAIGQELADAARTFAKIDVPSLGGFNVNATLKGDGDALSVAPLAVDIGKPDMIQLTVNGEIADALGQEGIDLAIAVASSQIANLTPVAEAFAPGQSIPPLGPLDVKASLKGGLGDGLAAQDVSVALGAADTLLLSVTGGIEDLMRQSGIDFAIAANSPELGNLSDIAEAYSGQSIPNIGPMALSTQVAGDMGDGVALNDLALDLGRAETISIKVSGGVEDLLQQSGIELNVAAVSPEIGNISPLVEAFSGAAVPALGPLDLALKVEGDATGTLSMNELALALGKAETLLVKANGTVEDLVALSGANLGFKVVSPDLSVLSDAAGSPVPPIGPVDISGTVQGDQGEPIVLNPFTATIGSSDIAGTVTFDGTGAVPSIVADLTSNRFDTNDLTPQAEGGQASSAGQSSGQSGSGSAAASDGRLIPNDPLPFEAMKGVNAELSYKAGTFVGAVAEMTNLDLGLSLKDGKLSITPLTAGIGSGSLDGAISLDGSQETAPLSIAINGSQMGLEALLAGAGMRDKIVGPIDLTIDLKGAGNSPRAIASSLNGEFITSLYGSRILKSAFEEQFGSTVAELLTSDGGWVVIDCAVFDYGIENGLATTKAGYTASGPVTVMKEGTMNLGSEQLDLHVEPDGGIVSLPLNVTGTFANPSVAPDAASVGVGLLAGVLTGGIAPALAAVVADLPDGHPCRDEVAQSQEQLENRQSSGEAAGGEPLKQLEEAGKEAIQESVGGALKNLFDN